MTKKEFLAAIRQRLAGLAQGDVERFLDYYAEMIDDRMEDGLSEEEAVASMGTPEYVAAQILMDSPVPAGKEKTRPLWWHWVLIVLSCPIWIPLVLAVLSVACSLLITFLSPVIALAVTAASLLAAGLGCTIAGIGGLFGSGLTAAMLRLTGAGMILTGIAILLGLGFMWGMKALIRLIHRAVEKLRNRRKEAQYE